MPLLGGLIILLGWFLLASMPVAPDDSGCRGEPRPWIPTHDCVSHPTRPDFADLCTHRVGEVMPVWDAQGRGRWVEWPGY